MKQYDWGTRNGGRNHTRRAEDLKWHEYPELSSSDRIGDLVKEIDDDPLACFFV